MKEYKGYVKNLDYFKRSINLIRNVNEIEIIHFDKIVGVDILSDV